MILDRLENFRLYCVPGTRLYRAFEYLANEWSPDLPDGRVEVDGDNIFALIQEYDTRPMGKCRFEAHLRYIDIQYVHEGAEIMGWAPVQTLPLDVEYDEEKDVAFFEQPVRFSSAEVTKGLFTVFFPADAHEPGIRMAGHNTVRKVVMKVRV
jgi:YhcH/YjgK/YiaL family protein